MCWTEKRGFGDTLRVLDLATGRELWTLAYEAAGRFMFAGSRTTPTVDGDYVYTVGPMGDLHAISIKTRQPAWRKNMWKDFGGGAQVPQWAIVQNPLIYGNSLITAAPLMPQWTLADDQCRNRIAEAIGPEAAAAEEMAGAQAPVDALAAVILGG